MFALLKRNLFIIIIFIITLSLAFITFLTFIDKSFIELNDKNLQLLLFINLILLLVFFIIIFAEVKNSLKNDINISIYNLMGQQVSVLHNGQVSSGYNYFTWDASNFSSGVYLIRTSGTNFKNTQKLMLIK